MNLRVLNTGNAWAGAASVFVLAMASPARLWIPFGPFSSFSFADVAIASATLIWLILIFASGTVPLGSKAVFIALLVPVIVSIFSLLWTIDIYRTLKVLVIYCEAVMAYLAAVYLLRPLRFETIAKLLAVFVGLVIISAVLSYVNLPGFSPQMPPELSSSAKDTYLQSYNARFSHPFIGLSNNLATVLAFYPFMLAACFKITGSRLYLWMLYAALIAILATLSRGVLLALIIALTLYLLTKSFRVWPLRKFVSGCIILLSGLALFVTLNPDAFYHLGSRFDARGIHTRLNLYRQTIEALESAPWLGYGAGVTLDVIESSILRNVHNTYLEHLLNLGMLGALPVLAALLALPLLILRLPVNSLPARKLRKAVAFSVTVELLVFASQPSFEGALLRVIFYFSVAAGVAMINASNRKPEFAY